MVHANLAQWYSLSPICPAIVVLDLVSLPNGPVPFSQRFCFRHCGLAVETQWSVVRHLRHVGLWFLELALLGHRYVFVYLLSEKRSTSGLKVQFYCFGKNVDEITAISFAKGYTFATYRSVTKTEQRQISSFVG